MKKMGKILALLLALVLTVGLFAGCNNNADPSQSSAGQSSTSKVDDDSSGDDADPTSYEWEYEEDTSPFEFTVWWPEVWAWARSSFSDGWDDSDVFTHITEKTGGKIDFDIPAGTEEDLAGPMIAAGTFPDVVVFASYTRPYIQQMIDAGQVQAFGDLIDEYCPKMWELIPDSQLAFHADESGTLWKYVGFEYANGWAEEAAKLGLQSAAGGAHGTNIMFVRQDTLTAYGKDDITDLDDFTDYLRFVKENFSDVEPLKLFDNNPRGELYTHFRATFGAHASGTAVQDDGTLKHFMYDQGYVDYLKWLNMLYREGVIAQNQLTDDTAAQDTKLYSASYGAIMSATYTAYNTLETTIQEAYGEDTDKVYVAVGPIQKEGVKWYAPLLRSKGGQATMITTNATQPDRVIKFFEYLLTEDGQMTMNGGVEGKQWNWVDGKWTPEEEFAAAAAKDLEAYCSTYKVNGTWSPWCNTVYWEGLLGQILTPVGRATEENEKRLGAEFVYDYWADGFVDITSCIPTGSDLDVIRKKIDDECTNVGMRMIAAADDATFEKLYNDCIAEIEALGVADVNAAFTAEYNAQKAALGIS